MPRNTDFLIGRNDQYVDRAALRGDALFALYICCRIDADAEPGEAIADALPDVRGMLANAAGEHQAVEAGKGICHHGDFCGDTKCEEIDGFAGPRACGSPAGRRARLCAGSRIWRSVRQKDARQKPGIEYRYNSREERSS